MGRTPETLPNNSIQLSPNRDRFRFKNVKLAIAGRITVATIALSGGILEGCQPSNNILEPSTIGIYQPVVPENAKDEISAEASAMNTLTDFLPQVLRPSYVPVTSSIALKQYAVIVNTFNAMWDVKQPTVNVIFTLSQDLKNLDSTHLYLTRVTDATPTVALTKTLTSEIFSLTPKGRWKCKPLASKGIYCENFWEDPTGVKTGIGLMQPFITDEDKNKKVIFMCQHNKNSQSYSWKSCMPEFADTGIQ